jgi:hypothetical protein
VRAGLIEIMCARDEWPFEYEWSRIAPSGLGAAIKRQHKRWAAAFRLSVRHQYRVRRTTGGLPTGFLIRKSRAPPGIAV